MTSALISVGDLANIMQQNPVTLVRALMDDPVSKTPDARNAMVLPASVDTYCVTVRCASTAPEVFRAVVRAIQIT